MTNSKTATKKVLDGVIYEFDEGGKMELLGFDLVARAIGVEGRHFVDVDLGKMVRACGDFGALEPFLSNSSISVAGMTWALSVCRSVACWKA